MKLLRKKNHTKVVSATIITSCMRINGDLEGNDTIHIDGYVKGNLTVENTLIIGKLGTIEGNVKAKNVIINGELKGTLICDHLEILSHGNVTNKIQANTIKVEGKIEGWIDAFESIDILKNGIVNTNHTQSEVIIVRGVLNGRTIATKLLEVKSYGVLRGEVLTKELLSTPQSNIDTTKLISLENQEVTIIT